MSLIGRKAGVPASEATLEQLGEKLPQLVPVAVSLHDAVTSLLDAMRMQECREREEFFLSQPTAKFIWDEAKTLGIAAVAAHGKLYEGTDAKLSVPEFVSERDEEGE